MAGNTKNLCAHIPVELHNKVREKQQASGKTLNDYITELITEFYEMMETGGAMSMSDTRTLAVQIPAELFDRMDEFLAARRIKKKDFIIGLIRDALNAAEAESDSGEQKVDSGEDAVDECHGEETEES